MPKFHNVREIWNETNVPIENDTIPCEMLVAFGKIYQSNSASGTSKRLWLHSGLIKTSLHDAYWSHTD